MKTTYAPQEKKMPCYVDFYKKFTILNTTYACSRFQTYPILGTYTTSLNSYC